MRRTLALVLVGWLMPAGVFAQPRTAPPNTDIIISLGWAGAEQKFHDFDRWRGALQVEGRVGHHWTDALKTEIGAAWAASGRDEVYIPFQHAGGVAYPRSEHRADELRLHLKQLHQFGRNAWVHPYIGAGVALVRRTTVLERRAQIYPAHVPGRDLSVVVPPTQERTTDVFAQAVTTAGLKLYVTERTSFTTEFDLAFRREVEHAVWKVGVGIDF